MGTGRDGCTADRICFLRGLADARITLLPRSWFRTGISRGNGPRGNGLASVDGGAVLAGRAPCWIAAASYVGGGSAGSAVVGMGSVFFSDIMTLSSDFLLIPLLDAVAADILLEMNKAEV